MREPERQYRRPKDQELTHRPLAVIRHMPALHALDIPPFTADASRFTADQRHACIRAERQRRQKAESQIVDKGANFVTPETRTGNLGFPAHLRLLPVRASMAMSLGAPGYRKQAKRYAKTSCMLMAGGAGADRPGNYSDFPTSAVWARRRPSDYAERYCSDRQ